MKNISLTPYATATIILYALLIPACHTTPTPPADDATIVITGFDASIDASTDTSLDANDAALDDSDPTDGSDGASRDECARACTNVRHLKCKAGFSVDGGSSCAVTCRHVQASHVTQLDVACALHALDATKLRACAGWGCL